MHESSLVGHSGEVHGQLLLQRHEALVDQLLGGVHADAGGQRVQHGGPAVVGDGIQGHARLRDQLLQNLILSER